MNLNSDLLVFDLNLLRSLIPTIPDSEDQNSETPGKPDGALDRLKDHLSRLPRLLNAQDEKFLGRTDDIAGRQVCADLYAMNSSAESRRRAWQVAQRMGADLEAVGHAAKMLERLNINWRELRELEDILQVARNVSELGPAH